MPHYMFQGQYSGAAIRAMVENPQDREAPARALAESMGATLINLWFTFGSDDIIAIYEAKDDETAAALSMLLGASGAFGGGSTTKLLSPAQAVSAMGIAKDAAPNYKPATD